MFNIIISILFLVVLIFNIAVRTKVKYIEKDKKNKRKLWIIVIAVDVVFFVGVIVANLIRVVILI